MTKDAKASEAWRVVDESPIVDASPWLRLSRQVVQLPGGRQVDDYYQLAIPDFVVVLALTKSRDTICLRHYKHGLRASSLTLPGGMVDPDEDPLAAAQREFLEETGYAGGRWINAGSYVVNGNLRICTGHFFLVEGASKQQAPDAGDLETMHLELIPADDLVARLKGGDVGLLNHASIIGFAALHGLI